MEDRRNEIIDYLLKTKLIETCIQYRLNKCTNEDWIKDMTQETWLWVMTYDLEKLANAYDNGHLSALVTRFICNQFFSKTSPFYKHFKKPEMTSSEITWSELNIIDPSTEEK